MPVLYCTASKLNCPPDYTACRCLTIKLSSQVVTMVTNHSKPYKGHTQVSINYRLANYRLGKLSLSLSLFILYSASLNLGFWGCFTRYIENF